MGRRLVNRVSGVVVHVGDSHPFTRSSDWVDVCAVKGGAAPKRRASQSAGKKRAGVAGK